MMKERAIIHNSDNTKALEFPNRAAVRKDIIRAMVRIVEECSTEGTDRLSLIDLIDSIILMVIEGVSIRTMLT